VVLRRRRTVESAAPAPTSNNPIAIHSSIRLAPVAGSGVPVMFVVVGAFVVGTFVVGAVVIGTLVIVHVNVAGVGSTLPA